MVSIIHSPPYEFISCALADDEGPSYHAYDSEEDEEQANDVSSAEPSDELLDALEGQSLFEQLLRLEAAEQEVSEPGVSLDQKARSSAGADLMCDPAMDSASNLVKSAKTTGDTVQPPYEASPLASAFTGAVREHSVSCSGVSGVPQDQVSPNAARNEVPRKVSRYKASKKGN